MSAAPGGPRPFAMKRNRIVYNAEFSAAPVAQLESLGSCSLLPTNDVKFLHADAWPVLSIICASKFSRP